ncbi:hypothetical protein L9F63_011000 [Diploptera punctata]|uniref:Uncharacterized protein n=1 Tax=Diploptera punctata TaxID=6984 RepID=A0AAD8AHN1_DIPPU|nr:hypothetical protein L9F63_011000 [Diploptera punctata]
MTRHKNPKTLETLALDSIAEFIVHTGRQLISKTTPIPPPSSKKFLDYIGINRRDHRLKKEQEDWESQQHIDMTCLHDYIHSGLPLDLSRKVVTWSLKAVDRFARELKCTYEHLNWYNREFHNAFVLKMLISSIIDPQLSLLHLSPMRWNTAVGQILWDNVYKMPKLEVLEFSVQAHIPNRDIIQGLSCLEHLFSFTMRRCTDRIIVTLVTNCPKIEYLDICSSPDVTDASVDYILKLNQLKELLFYHTSITKKGLTKILKGIAHWNCNFADGRVRQNGLTNFHAGRPSTEHMKLLVQVCPFLTSVRLSHIEGDMSILSVLNDLIEIEIIHGNFTYNNIKGLLKLKGNNLRTLVLIKMKEVDLNFICESCMGLKTLVLLRGRSSVSIEALKAMNPAPLQHLEYLVLDSTCGIVFVELLLSFCVNIKRIQIGHTENIDDTMMERVFRCNPMISLEMIILISSTNALSMRTVRYLVNSCPNIYLLGDLREWNQITEEEIRDFQSEIRSCNLDISLALNLLEKSPGISIQDSDETFLGSHVLH